jgi:hypothetical protein
VILRRPSPPLLLLAGYALLLLAWLMSNPPFRSPDEIAHYLRAAGISEGRIVGKDARFQAPALNVLGLTPRQQRTFDAYSRRVDVAPVLAPFPCRAGRPCRTVTYVGNYQPLPYLLPAVAMRAGDSPAAGNRLARAGAAAGALGFLALAAALLWGAGPRSLLGLTAAVTPMVLFTGAVVNPAGLEIAAGLAMTAAVLRVHRHGGDAPGRVWAALGLSGAATALAWQLGPVFMAFNFLLLLALLGPGGLRTVRETRPGPAMAALAALVAGGAGYLAWRGTAGGDRVVVSVDPLGRSLDRGVEQLGNSFEGVVGVFGVFSDLELPLVWHLAWAVGALAVVALGLRAAGRRERAVLAAAILVALAFPVLFFGAIYRHTGFLMQGRYILPLVLIVPLLAGEALARSRRRAAWDGALRWLPALFGLVQLAAWWVNAHAAAVGTGGPWWFLGGDDFTPPLGWLVWTLVAAAGAAAVAASGLPVRRAAALPARPAERRASAAGARDRGAL